MKLLQSLTHIIIGLSLLVCISCEKTIPAVEPDIASVNDVKVYGDFAIKLNTLTDHQVYLTWKALANAVSYDIIINDTLLMPHITNTYCTVTGLKADAAQKITIRAISKYLTVKTAIVTFRTMKVLIAEASMVELNKYQYANPTFTYCKKITDGGYLFIMNSQNITSTCALAIKTDKDLNVIWKTELSFGDDPISTYYRSFTDVVFCKDGSYLLVLYKSIFKLSSRGAVLWKTNKLFDDNIRDNVTGGIELADGSYWIVGTSYRNWGSAISSEYTLTQLSSNGTLVWKKYGGNSLENYSCKIVKKDDDHFFIFGTTDISGSSFSQLSNINATMNLVEVNGTGNFMGQQSFDYCTNETKARNQSVPLNILISEDHSYYLVGQGFGVYGETQIVKISSSGSLLWDYKGYKSGESNASPKACNILTGNRIAIVAFLDYDWFRINEFNADGTLFHTMDISHFSDCIFIDKDELGRYIYITTDGIMYKINPDGYNNN